MSTTISQKVIQILFLVIFLAGTLATPFAAYAQNIQATGNPNGPGLFDDANLLDRPSDFSAGDISATFTGSASCLGAGLIGGGVTSAAAAAIAVPTNDAALNVVNASELSKECILDSIVVVLRETLIRKITTSIVTWINSGFEGSPAFITNIDQYLLDTADETFGFYIENSANFAHLCSPFEFDVRFALALSYSRLDSRPTCRLSDVAENVETAIDDLSVEWDWDVYETITTDPSGNRFFSFFQVQEDISNQIQNTIQNERDDIERGDGFLSYKECTDAGTYDEESQQLVSKQDCSIVTPGSVINTALSDQLNAGNETLALADEFNEIIGALMGQLSKQAFGGGGGGVSGLSKRSGNSNSFLSRYNQDAQQASSNLASDIAVQGTGTGAESANQYTNYITTQNQSIETLVNAKLKVTEVHACYNSKYNTWLSADGAILSETEIANTPIADRTRAVFNAPGDSQAVIFELLDPTDELTPTESLAKVQELQAILDKIDQDLITAESAVQNAQNAITATNQYERDLAGAQSNPAAVQQIQSAYLQNTNSFGVNTVAAESARASIEYYVDQAINGTYDYVSGSTVKRGGAIQELSICQSYSLAVQAGAVNGTN